MHALVTGGLGYLGHAVTVELLDDGWDVTVLSRRSPGGRQPAPSGVRLVAGDLLDPERLSYVVATGRFDAVVHLAGLSRARESVARPLDYFDANVGGTLNLLRALGAAGPALVQASTTLVYGPRAVGALTEDAALHPETPYAQSKVAAEQLVRAQAATGELSAVVLRIFNVGGGVDGVGDTDPTRIIPSLLHAAADEHRRATLAGDGTAVRDFVHVADVARAVRLATAAALAASRGSCPTYNVGSGVGSRVLDVLGCVEEVVGRRLQVDRTPEETVPVAAVADISRAQQALGWAPERSDLYSIVADAWKCWPR